MRPVGQRVRAMLVTVALAMLVQVSAAPGGGWGQLLSVREAAAAPRVAFANAAELDRGARTLIESLRSGLIQDGYEIVPPGALRDSLEAPLAASEDQLARARELLANAKDAYAGFQFKVAIEQLGAVDAALANQPRSTQLVNILAERYVLEGLVHSGAKNQTAAEAAFAVVRRIRPEMRLDPATYHPRIVALFERAGAAPRAEITVEIAAPQGARVFVDDKLVGNAPLETTLATGIHYVSLSGVGFVPSGSAVEVTADTTQLSFPLEPAPPESRARRLRNELQSAASITELRAAAGELCSLAEADILVVIRNRASDSSFEGAVYRCQSQQLSDWIATPSAQFFAALGPAVPAPAGNALDPRLVPPPPVDERKPPPAWYGTWWGRGLIVGATVVAGTALYLTLRPEDEYVIGGWCVGQGCNQ